MAKLPEEFDGVNDDDVAPVAADVAPFNVDNKRCCSYCLRCCSVIAVRLALTLAVGCVGRVGGPTTGCVFCCEFTAVWCEFKAFWCEFRAFCCEFRVIW